jgi:hypothetical protein
LIVAEQKSSPSAFRNAAMAPERRYLEAEAAWQFSVSQPAFRVSGASRRLTARNAIAPTLKNDGDGRQHEQWEKRHNFRGDWVCIAPMHDEFQQVRKETSQEVHMNRVCRRLPGAKNL